jgi:hypothetical protein
MHAMLCNCLLLLSRTRISSIHIFGNPARYPKKTKPDVADVTVPWSSIPVLSVHYGHRLILGKREAKAVTEADTEALDWWYDLEDDFELLSFKAWNAVIYQVIPCSLLSLLCIPTDCLP